MTEISIDKLHNFPGHPYKVRSDAAMESLIESIREYGILSPLLVYSLRQPPDEFEIISGHRRFYAAKQIGLKTVPAIICNIDRNTASIMLVDSNLHRENLLPSEKAFAYKLKAEALKQQGRRTDLTMGQVVPKSDENRTLSTIGRQTGESYKTIQRYIRLTSLIPELLDMMDQGRIAFSVGYELSFLSEEMQRQLLDIIRYKDCTPSYSQAVRMHKAVNCNNISVPFLRNIMNELKGNQKESIRIPMDNISTLIPCHYTHKQIQKLIVDALEFYVAHSSNPF